MNIILHYIFNYTDLQFDFIERSTRNGIIVSTISGVIVVIVGTFLAQEIISFNDGPDLVVTNSYNSFVKETDIDTRFKVDVFNQGNKVAEHCTILFDPDTSDNDEGLWSNVFSVIPNNVYTLEFDEIRYDEPKRYGYSALVECENNPRTKALVFGVDIEKPLHLKNKP